jgi:hypothetical protein
MNRTTRPAPIAGRRQDVTACEWRIGEVGLEELRIVERAHPSGMRYAVKWLSYVANWDYEWEFEPQPSSRDAAFFARCRFIDWETAYQIAIRMPLDSTGAHIP